LAVLAAVLTGISAAAPEGPPKTTVVRAASQLPGGSRLSADDLHLDQVVASDVPEGAVNDPASLVGRTLAAPVAKGQMMTEFAVASARDPSGRGRVLAPLRLADAEVVALLQAGDVVDVLAADAQSEEAYVAARGARVVAVPQPSDSTRGDAAGALVLVEVDQETARVLARAAVAATLTVIWR
jgi:Flp pilus assembly protein CpaB